MATTLASGEQITVLAEVGFITNFFVLDDAEAGVLSGYTTTTTRTNLMGNPNFETNTISWGAIATSGTPTLARITTDDYIGTASLEVTKATGRNETLEETAIGTITAGNSYTISGYMKVPTGNETMIAGARALFFNSSNVQIGSFFTGTTSSLTNTSGWVRFSVTATAPTNSSYVRAYFGQTAGGTSGQKFLVDAVLVEQSSLALPYFDGTYADTYTGYTLTEQAWTGTADASTSTAIWGLNSSLITSSYVLDGNLEGVDITEYCQEVSITRGRQDQFAQFNAGQCAIKLVNNDRRFDPINEDSPYWDTAAGRSGVVPRRKVTITSGSNYLFTGRITDIDVVYDYNLSTVTITAADDFVLLANTVVEADVTPSVELSGARVNYLLDLPEIDYPLTTRNISTGLATLGAYTISANTNALTYLQQIATSEQGACFIAANGDLTFTDRLDASFATVAAEFSDDGTNIPYTALQVIYGQEFLYNRIQATIQGGTVQIADDAASQAEFGITTYALPDLLLESDSEALTLANYLVALYANPQYRFDDLGLVTSAMSAPNRDAINALELQDVVTVTRTYTTGSPLSVTEFYAVERLTHLITAGEHRVTVGLFNTEILYELILDDPIFGILDSTNALA